MYELKSKYKKYLIIVLNLITKYTIIKIDSESGPYKTIQEAINAAEPGSTIKIAPGLYNDNIYIK